MAAIHHWQVCVIWNFSLLCTRFLLLSSSADIARSQFCTVQYCGYVVYHWLTVAMEELWRLVHLDNYTIHRGFMFF